MIKNVRPAASASAEAPIALLDPPVRLNDEDVAELAYSYWEARGCQGGSPEEDWLRAEQELMSLNARG
jgi:hypothetical protein